MAHGEEPLIPVMKKNPFKNAIMIPVLTVPGGVYTDLSRNNIIEDNLFGSNDVNNRWVRNQSVVYTKNFNVDSDFLKAREIVLIFHGIDTFANVSLNGHTIGQTSNMFLRYIFDVIDYIKDAQDGQNLLQVAFRSTVKVAEDLYNEQGKNYTVPPGIGLIIMCTKVLR